MGVLTRPLAPGRAAVIVVMLVALPLVFFPLLNGIEKFDWNALGQKLIVMVFWTVAFALSFAWIARNDAEDRRGLAWILVVGPALVLVYVARFTRFLGTGAELARVTSIGAIAVFVFQAIALVLMLVVLWQVEKLLRAKAAAMPAKAPAARDSAAAEGAEAS